MADIDTLIAELRAGLEGTTPGEWKTRVHAESTKPDAVVADGRFVARCQPLFGRPHHDDEASENARHIALASPQNVRALLDHIDRLTSERDAADDRLDAVRIDLLTEQSERKVAEAGLARLRAPVMEGEVGDCLAKLNNRKVNEPDFGMRLRHEAADLLQHLAARVAEGERVDALNVETIMKMNREIVAGHDRLREAVEVITKLAADVEDLLDEYDDKEQSNHPQSYVLVRRARAFLSTLEDNSNGDENDQ